MNLQATVSVMFTLVVGGALFFGACSENNSDNCPATITAGDNCTSIDLQCPYTVTVNGCDGTTSMISTSCSCTKATASTAGSTWVCADPGTQCPDSATPADDGGDESSTDDGSMDDGGDESSTDDGSMDDASDAGSTSDAADAADAKG